MTPPRPTPTDWLFLGLLGFIWGGSFLGVALALPGFDPVWIAALRIAIGAAALLALIPVMGGMPGFATRTEKRIWAHALGFALFTNVIPFLLLSWAIQHVTSGFAGITMAAVPLLVLPLAHLLVPGERLGLWKALGFVLGFAGVLALIGPEALAAAFAGDDDGLARLACVGASACYAVGSINTRLCPPVSPFGYSAAGLLLAAVIILPIALWAAPLPQAPGPVPLGAVLFLGLLPTAVATLMLVRVNRGAGPSFMSLVNYQVPVWSVILGMAVLGEALPPQFLLALVLILAGLALGRIPARR